MKNLLETSEWILSGSLILILASLLVISRFHEHRKKQYLTSCSSAIERLIDIEISGEVLRPGVYSALPGVRLGDLVKKSRPKRFADLQGFDLDSPVEVPLNLVIPKLAEITVKVEGAVAEEVELTMPSGSRVCDLKSKIHLDKGADSAYLKRRRFLQNGEVVVIPRQQSKKQGSLGSALKLEKSKACLKIGT